MLRKKYIHVKARSEQNKAYAGKRFPVPDDSVPWDVPMPEYAPIAFTAEVILAGPHYADPPDPSEVCARVSSGDCALSTADHGVP